MKNHALVKYLCCAGKKEKELAEKKQLGRKNKQRIIELQGELWKIKVLLKCFILKMFSYLLLLTGFMVNQIFWESVLDFLPLQIRCLMFDSSKILI